MREDRGGCKGRLECFECLSAIGGEIPWGAFSGESCEGNREIQVAVNESRIEIGEPEEGLYVANLLRLCRGTVTPMTQSGDQCTYISGEVPCLLLKECVKSLSS